MRIVFMLLLLGAGLPALADDCEVFNRSSSSAVQPVVQHSCYSFTGMPAEAIAWSCSNESKAMVSSDKRRVPRCADGSLGRCIAPLTQEALANPEATGRDQPSTRPALPDDARVITYYYDTPSLAQARSDCERADGLWQAH
ncbi:hypothetical protein [Pseudomonas sp. UFMG81]|jgi:hypothetical protein|uniref:hypothetical protein n=1 Tax=Pseudomonas sp. UFMG81 TaxID=2745936 RepID=UPI00189076C8|nr:hypothetical protein [Pseudomonas sp. UFMG81]